MISSFELSLDIRHLYITLLNPQTLVLVMVEFKEKPDKEEDILKIMHPYVKEWFFKKFKEFSLPQKFGVSEIHARQNIIVSAPTGATKTLTAFLSILNELVDSADKGILEDKIYAVYETRRWAAYNDLWHDGDPEYSCPDGGTPNKSPPTPRRGFGKIWCTQPSVRQNLGWATEEEHGSDIVVQRFQSGLILRTDRWTWVFYGDGSWERR